MANDDTTSIDTTEPLLSIDKKNLPLVAKDGDAMSLLLIRLILMEPGLIQTHPDMGVGLVSRYRYCNESDMKQLNNLIKSQINCYLPQFAVNEVKCEMAQEYNGNVIRIHIRTNQNTDVYLPINTVTGEVMDTAKKTSKLADIK